MQGQTTTARRTPSARRRTVAGAVAVLGVAALAALPASAGAHALAGRSGTPVTGTPTTTTTTGPPAHVTPTGPPILLAGGKSVTPALGDWEGTVGGLPASFDLTRDPHARGANLPAYGIDQLVAIVPAGCPASMAQVREVQLASHGPVRLGSGGTLGLGHVGFGGALTSGRAATLTRDFHLSGCSGTQTWHMHPALRLPVSDGHWTVHFGGGTAGTFSVIDGGRLAAAIPLTKQLGLCEGLTGTVDVFIGPRGTATSDDPELRVSLRFTKGSARGSFTSAGPHCASRRIPVTAALAAGSAS
jgi:hypothetical protein